MEDALLGEEALFGEDSLLVEDAAVALVAVPSSALVFAPSPASVPPVAAGETPSALLSGPVEDASVTSSVAAVAAVEGVPVDGASPGVGAWKLASVAVAVVWLRSAALVSGPTMPSTVSPLLAWKVRTASSVSGPKTPSTLIEPRAC